MANDKAAAFKADVESAEDRREQLRRELAELDGDADAPVAEHGDLSVDSFDGIDPETVEVESKMLGRTLLVTRPTSAEMTLFASDVSSRLINDVQRTAIMSDFCQTHIDPEDFLAWRDEVLRRGSSLFFYESIAAMVDMLEELVVDNDSEQEWESFANRQERRKAEREKAARQKAREAKLR
ncbi:TPA: hypothetical protein ACQXVA_002052, partial [Streptococcus pneumoniae]